MSPFNNEVIAYVASLNGAVLSFWASVCAIIMYIVFSLTGKKEVFNLDKMLHRGEYAVDADKTEVDSKPVTGLRAMLGMGKDFNFRDKVVYLSMVAWTLGLVVLFFTLIVINLTFGLSDRWWEIFWKCYIWVSLIAGAIVTVWFTIGGIFDIKYMFKKLSGERTDELDDGRVLEKQE